MTVAALPSVVSYVEDGATLAFPVPYRFDLSGLVVERIIDGEAVPLAVGVDYTVSGGATDAGGTVTRAIATNGAVLRIRRQTPLSQPMVYTTGDRFPADSHEAALDRQAMAAQDIARDAVEGLQRAIQFPVGEVAPKLPIAAERRDTVVAFHPGTGELITKPVGSFPAGPAGPADNTYTSLSALLASDKSRKKANLVGDTDVPPAPDGPYNVVGGVWKPQGASGISASAGPTGPLLKLDDAFQFGARMSRYDYAASDKTAAFRDAIEEASERKVGKIIVPVETNTGLSRWDIQDSIATPEAPLPDGLKIVGEGALNPEHPLITTGKGTFIVYHGLGAIFDMHFEHAGVGARRGGWEFADLRLGWTDLNAAGAFRIQRQNPNYQPSDLDDYAYVQNVLWSGHGWMGYMGDAVGVVKGAGISGAKMLGGTIGEGWQPSRARYSIDLLGCDDMRIKCMRSGPIRHRRANTFGNNLMIEVPWCGFGDPAFTDPDDEVYALHLSGNSSFVNVRHIELSGYTPALKAIVFVDGDSDTLELGALTGVNGPSAVPIARIGPNCRDVIGRGWTAIVPDARQAVFEDAPVSRSYGDIRNDFRLTLTGANENMRALAIKSATRVVLDRSPSIPGFGIARGYSPDVRRVLNGGGRYPAEVIATPRGFDFPYGGNAQNAPLKVVEEPVPDGAAFKIVHGQGQLILGLVQAGIHFAPGAKLTIRARIKAQNAASNISFYYLKNGGFVATISDCKTGGVYREDTAVVDTTGWVNGDTLSYQIADGAGNTQDLYAEYHGVTQ